MSDQPDGDAPKAALDVPPTRKHDAIVAIGDEPPARASRTALAAPPAGFPDDGPLARHLRVVDDGLGTIEQALLFTVLAVVVIVAASSALSDRVFGHPLGRWWHYIVRGGTFVVALLGAVFATHQQRHLAMDLISRRLSPRGRLVLGLVLKLFTIVIALVLFHTGWHLRDTATGIEKEHLDLELFTITDKEIVAAIPIGAALIALHSLLHAVIDVDYLVRGKLPPERARSAH